MATKTKPKRRVPAGRAASKTTRRPASSSVYPLHKRVLLHPLGLFAFLCMGVFMAGWTYRVVAATIVSTTVEAPALRTAATVQSPVSGATTKTAQINVNGSCPQNSYVSLSINDSFNGVAWCSTNGDYNITTSLYSGTNTLVVQAYNQTNMAGPTSAPVQVTYTPPPPVQTSSGKTTVASGNHDTSTPTSGGTPSASSNTTSAAPATATPLLLTSNFQFHTFTSEQTFNWQLDLEGGTPPYRVVVSWGDRTTSNLTFPGDPVFTISHRYKAAGYFPVVVRSTDDAGQLHTTQLAALITNTDGTAPFVGAGTTTSGGSSSPAAPAGTSKPFGPFHLSGTVKLLLLAWPSYLIILLMTISFWLGEKQEFVLLRAYRRRRAH